MATVAAGAKEQSSRRLKEGCSVKDILDKVQKKGGETSWDDTDPRWEEQPLIGERFPTAVFCKVEIVHLKDIDTTLGTAFVKLHVFLNWHDHRLVGRRVKPYGPRALPPRLWAPHLELAEARADMKVTTRAFMQVPFANVRVCERSGQDTLSLNDRHGAWIH